MMEKLLAKSVKDDDVEGNGEVPILTSIVKLFQYFKVSSLLDHYDE